MSLHQRTRHPLTQKQKRKLHLPTKLQQLKNKGKAASNWAAFRLPVFTRRQIKKSPAPFRMLGFFDCLSDGPITF
jgi:hypothetical protein